MADMALVPSANVSKPSFRGDAKHRTRNLEIPGLVLTHHPGMTARESVDQVGNVQLFSSLVAAITSSSSLGPGTAGLEVKMSQWFLILSAGSAVNAYISCINW